MKICNLTATDMGENQSEISDKVLEYVDGINYASKNDFYEVEYALITKACNELGWLSVPQCGGLEVEWMVNL